MEEFNFRLKKLRDKLNLSQEEFAQKLNTSQSSYYRWESGNQYPRIDEIKKIIIILEETGYDLEWLLFGIDPDKKHEYELKLQKEIERLNNIIDYLQSELNKMNIEKLQQVQETAPIYYAQSKENESLKEQNEFYIEEYKRLRQKLNKLGIPEKTMPIDETSNIPEKAEDIRKKHFNAGKMGYGMPEDDYDYKVNEKNKEKMKKKYGKDKE